ncbi:MAG: hypothetical protein WCF85_09025 [Rhodospirillaceae bacterium]
MKFLGTLAFGFSTIAAMIAALLAFGFQVKVESPLSPQSIAKDQQLSQCTTALNQAEQQVADARSKAQGLELRLRDAVIIADQAAARLSVEVSKGAQLATERTALAGTTSTVATGIGVSLLMFPLGFLLGRNRRNSGQPMLTAAMPEIVVQPPREPAGVLPVFEPRASRSRQRSGALR